MQSTLAGTKLRKSAKLFLATMALSVYGAIQAFAGTVVVSTTTYPGRSPADESAISLPEIGAYAFDVVVAASGTAFTSVDLYLQHQGISGTQHYTVNNSTITQCTGACTRFITPDLYMGGSIRAWWTVVGASATITVTARQLSP